MKIRQISEQVVSNNTFKENRKQKKDRKNKYFMQQYYHSITENRNTETENTVMIE